MTVERNLQVSLTAVLALNGPARDAPCTLELRGPLDAPLLEAALAHLAAARPALRDIGPPAVRHGPGRHVLACDAAYPLGALADLLTAAAPAHPHTGHEADHEADGEGGTTDTGTAAGSGRGDGDGRDSHGHGHGGNDRARDTNSDTDRDADRGLGTDTDTDRGGVGVPHRALARRRGPVRLPEPLALTPLQRELLADTADFPRRQIAQLLRRWHGPLDTGRFTAAWQQVFDHESVLRAALVFDPRPRIALHARARPEVRRHTHGSLTRQDLMEQERRRGFEPGRPGLLRAALLEGPPPEPHGGCAAPTDVILTYHRALLDGRSVRLLLQEFYRAYLAAGFGNGGERRPDLRDYRTWLAAQDTAPARDFWTGTTPAAHAGAGQGLPRARPGAVTGRRGTGRTLARLTRAEAVRLAQWAALWGATPSSALQTVWAMILYAAAHPDTPAPAPTPGPGPGPGSGRGPAPVTFSVTVSGRGIAMEGIERVPGPFDNPLPVHLDVDPQATVGALLRAVRDRILDMAAYEWVSAGQIRHWLTPTASHTGGGGGGPATLLCFEHHPRPPRGLAAELAAQGIHVEDTGPATGQSAFAIGVVAHHDSTGDLVLSAVHDRGRLHDDQAAQMLAHSARLLRELPAGADESTTVAQALSQLAPTDTPRLHEAPARPAHRRLRRLRAPARPGAGTICLIAPPGAPEHCHSELARRYQGPQAVTVLRADAARMPQCLTALAPLLAAGERLVLGGFSGSGALALEVARHIAAAHGRAPLVVLGAPYAAGEALMRDLARALAAAARRGG
ncbi:condensation domain-containing protein [Streptomyces aureoverticillatus]|uniref:condensation domain-containing protein n=1 Tax=Streptomyces aureoverticillatus TaxID=66871 RepID=UPI0013DBD1AA|nr:condensation domain-containing protein [Streptomyces aureoverticillatus]QIB41732.1 peptide synthase condensation domain-containing protein [Streptomyces aureoverticillatus]QIB48406.1 peptide synthase condensation domain-containing protein [Streptomyces aureoverticillatus]